MSPDDRGLTDQLRSSLERHADEAPQIDLTSGALRQARRMRGRRRVAAGIAAAALVAVAVPVAIQVGGDSGPDNTIATQPSQTQATVVQLLQITDEPLLTDDDVNPVGTYDRFRMSSSASAAQGYDELMCLPRIPTVGAEQMRQAAWFSMRNEGTFIESVLQMPGIDQAERLVDDQRTLPDQCGQIESTRIQTVHQPEPVTVEGADEALVWSVEIVPGPDDPGSEPSWFGIGMIRQGNVVVVMTFGAFGDPTDGHWSDYVASTGAVALQRAVG